MTRSEFLENITTFWELIEFCEDQECSICEDVLDGDRLDEEVDEDIENVAADWGWREIRDRLDDIPEHAETGYFAREGTLDYTALTYQDFLSFKDDVCEWMTDNEYWDEEEDVDIDVELDFHGPASPEEEIGEICEDEFLAVLRPT